jgi:hypothetical protein
LPTAIGQRRSERLRLNVPLFVTGKSIDQRTFREETFTLLVNAHGALLMLETKVAIGQKVVLMNQKNWDECEGRVTFIGPLYAGVTKVGIEFVQPKADFWSVSRPPQDWNQY